jgi:hypothetical protein
MGGEAPSSAGRAPTQFFVEVENSNRGVPLQIRVPKEDFGQPQIIEEANNTHGWKVRFGQPPIDTDIVGKM